MYLSVDDGGDGVVHLELERGGRADLADDGGLTGEKEKRKPDKL